MAKSKKPKNSAILYIIPVASTQELPEEEKEKIISFFKIIFAFYNNDPRIREKYYTIIVNLDKDYNMTVVSGLTEEDRMLYDEEELDEKNEKEKKILGSIYHQLASYLEDLWVNAKDKKEKDNINVLLTCVKNHTRYYDKNGDFIPPFYMH